MRLPLNGGAYQARSIIANAQRAVNLYAERNSEDAPVKLTHYACPGLTALGTAPGAPGRGLYWANNDKLYYVAGNTLYAVSSSWALTAIGTIGTTNGTVSMADNGVTMVLVDGSPNGYQVTLATNGFSAISGATNSPPVGSGMVYGFYGADMVDMIDGFMLFNQPGTQNWYCTYDNSIVFDSTYFTAKNGYSDLLVGIAVARRNIWVIGERTTEIWSNVGDSGFPFAITPGPFEQHGCCAKYSIAKTDGAVFWLSQDQTGNAIMVRAEGYQAKRISTHALEQEWQSYATVADAVGFVFQIGGHGFYQINFPTANKSWRYDETTELWHQAVYVDGNGNENMDLASCVAFAYGVNVAADATTGQLYKIDTTNNTHNGAPMYFRRGFPHLVSDGRRGIYPGFTLDVQAATSVGTLHQPGPFVLESSGTSYGTGASLGFLSGPAPINTAPQVLLRWSDDRGATWSNPVPQSLGATGEYLVQPHWNRLGMARDRIFEVFGVIPGQPFAINGAWLDPEPIKLKS